MQGLVKKVVGHINDPGIDILTIVYKHGILTEFSKEALQQADEVPEKISEADFSGTP